MQKRIVLMLSLFVIVVAGVEAQRGAPPPGSQKVTAIRAGRLIDPETGMAAANQIIVI